MMAAARATDLHLVRVGVTDPEAAIHDTDAHVKSVLDQVVQPPMRLRQHGLKGRRGL